MSETIERMPTNGAKQAKDHQDLQALAQELVQRARTEGVDLVGPGGLLTGLTKTVLETALDVELTEHLGYDKHDPAGRGSGNSRNGTRSKQVLTELGPVEVDVPLRPQDGVRHLLADLCAADSDTDGCPSIRARTSSAPPSSVMSLEGGPDVAEGDGVEVFGVPAGWLHAASESATATSTAPTPMLRLLNRSPHAGPV